jgi:hypothetical protein
MIRSFFISILLLSTILLTAQIRIIDLSAFDDNSFYENEMAIEGGIRASGFYLGFVKGKYPVYYRHKFFFARIGNLKHPKEYRQAFGSFGFFSDINTAYVYGKQNAFIYALAGVGQTRYLVQKARNRGTQFGVSYRGGINLGMLKPYYLEVYSPTTGSLDNVTTIKYDEENIDQFLEQPNIRSRAGFFKGIDEIMLRPGLYVSSGVVFSWGEEDKLVRILEAGLIADLYPGALPIMVVEHNKSIFLNLYVTLRFGKRY